MAESVLTGHAAAPGIATGTAHRFRRYVPPIHRTRSERPEAELAHLRRALDEAVCQLTELERRVRAELTEQDAAIFRAQRGIAEDPTLAEEAAAVIETSQRTAAAAIDSVLRRYERLFAGLGDDGCNRARLTDVRDLRGRLLRILLGADGDPIRAVPERGIVIAKDLSPTDTAQLPRDRVAGFVTAAGGVTSHAAVLARSMGIPAIVGAGSEVLSVEDGTPMALDAGASMETGTVYVRPAPGTERCLQDKANRRRARNQALADAFDPSPKTRDGVRLPVYGNLTKEAQVEECRELGIPGVGLLRTEFLYLGGSGIPEEERQFDVYRQVAEAIAPGPVTIRTFDLGGDKPLPGRLRHAEANPALGVRGLRLSLQSPTMLRAQLRAIIRASQYGNVRILFPMVTTVEDLDRALVELDTAYTEVGLSHGRNLPVGAMIEVPSAVFLARELAQRVDTLSLGTNDLTQYLFAADRLNSAVNEWYRPLHPALFRAIAVVTEAARTSGCTVSVCGEAGGLPRAIPVFVGLGIDELSVTPQLVPQTVARVKQLSREDAVESARRATSCSTEEELAALLTEIEELVTSAEVPALRGSEGL